MIWIETGEDCIFSSSLPTVDISCIPIILLGKDVEGVTQPNQTKPNQTKPNQIKPNQTKPNQTKLTRKSTKLLTQQVILPANCDWTSKS